MQIILSSNDIRAAVISYIEQMVTVRDDQSLQVELQDDDTISVIILSPGEEAEAPHQASTSERPAKRARRTKAQIEADNKAEEERKQEAQAQAASGNEAPTQTTSVEAAKPTEPAQAEAAGEVTQTESENPGIPEAETVADPIVEEPAEPAVAVEPEPEVVAEPEPQAEAAPSTPTKSLFANLRRPNNG